MQAVLLHCSCCPLSVNHVSNVAASLLLAGVRQRLYLALPVPSGQNQREPVFAVISDVRSPGGLAAHCSFFVLLVLSVRVVSTLNITFCILHVNSSSSIVVIIGL